MNINIEFSQKVNDNLYFTILRDDGGDRGAGLSQRYCHYCQLPDGTIEQLDHTQMGLITAKVYKPLSDIYKTPELDEAATRQNAENADRALHS